MFFLVFIFLFYDTSENQKSAKSINQPAQIYKTDHRCRLVLRLPVTIFLISYHDHPEFQ